MASKVTAKNGCVVYFRCTRCLHVFKGFMRKDKDSGSVMQVRDFEPRRCPHCGMDNGKKENERPIWRFSSRKEDLKYGTYAFVEHREK